MIIVSGATTKDIFWFALMTCVTALDIASTEMGKPFALIVKGSLLFDGGGVGWETRAAKRV